ncbi:hypothetical protein Bcop_1790 [Bacteroides coprosuis DSM 18011]|uniref:Uncharacterized protein n=1 Tax=Bacteroides coprosuis DSM 18011 TaxID=679937 RepID=F3ZRP1_9BACE|nr:hypothetical protein Bcop_1790 [Bacteroides coprosuis DSM 18011]
MSFKIQKDIYTVYMYYFMLINRFFYSNCQYLLYFEYYTIDLIISIKREETSSVEKISSSKI